MRRSRATPSAPSAADVAAKLLPRPRVSVCVDLDDDVAVIRAIHHRFGPDRGHLVITVCPQAGTVEHLIRAMLIELNVLWRLPADLQRSGAFLEGQDRADAEWEISWALTRLGITRLWVLDADRATMFAWRWLRDTADREDLHLTLHTTAVPAAVQVAALTGCRVRALSPDLLSDLGRPSLRESPSPGWSKASGGTGRPFRG